MSESKPPVPNNGQNTGQNTGQSPAQTPRPGSGPSAAQVADQFGLKLAGQRPSLADYVRDLWRRRDFVRELASARSESHYAGSRLGQMWEFLNPVLNVAVYYLIFGILLEANRGVENYMCFLVAGVFTYTFSQRVAMSGSQSISKRLDLVRALRFPRAALPISAVMTEMRQMLISMGILLVVAVATGEGISARWLLLIPALVLITMFNTGLALALARLTARLGDIKELIPFVMRTWQYLSGVFFSIPVFAADQPKIIRDILLANPMAANIDIVRSSVMATTYDGYPHAWLVAGFWAVLSLVGGFLYFYRGEASYGRG